MGTLNVLEITRSVGIILENDNRATSSWALGQVLKQERMRISRQERNQLELVLRKRFKK